MSEAVNCTLPGGKVDERPLGFRRGGHLQEGLHGVDVSAHFSLDHDLAKISRNGIEAARADHIDSGVSCLGVVGQLHALQKLRLSGDVQVVGGASDAGSNDLRGGEHARDL